MGVIEAIRSLWQKQTIQYLHGWIAAAPAGSVSTMPTVPTVPGETGEPGEGKYYAQVRCTAMSLRFSQERFAGRTPVLQSIVAWPSSGQPIRVSQTLDHSRFTVDGAQGNGPSFTVFEVSDRQLSGFLPLNSGDVEVDIALLAAPGSSVLDKATAFLNDVASLTLVPQLTTAAPVAQKVADGVDALLGNDEVKGVLAISTSISASTPRAGFYLVTDLPASEAQLKDYRVEGGQLLRRQGYTDTWARAEGFSYLVFEVRVEGSKPSRWKELPDLAELSEAALRTLANARTKEDIAEAAPQMRLAVVKALYSPDLTDTDRAVAATALREEWRRQADLLRQESLDRGGDAGPSRRADPDGKPAEHGADDAADGDDAAAAAAAETVEAADRVGAELDDVISRVVLGTVTVSAVGAQGEVTGARLVKDADLRAGDISVTADNAGEGAKVTGITFA